MSDEVKLLPCPFCGAKAELFERYPKLWNVHCIGDGCGVTIDPAQRSHEACAEVWNARADKRLLLDDIAAIMGEFVDNWPKPKPASPAPKASP